jgi:hypothetical protein
MQPRWTVKEILAQVARFGFCYFATDAAQVRELVRALRRFQFIVSKTSLQVKHASTAGHNTLSAKYGMDAFPFHTDFAFRAIPPRYILLLNSTDSHFLRPTLVTRMEMLSARLQQQIRLSTWKLVTSEKHYLVSGQFIRNGQKVWRWDCDFLSPANREAEQTRSDASMAMLEIAEPIMWPPQSAVLIDNWCCVHARAGKRENDQFELNRTLLRIEFWGDARMVL